MKRLLTIVLALTAAVFMAMPIVTAMVTIGCGTTSTIHQDTANWDSGSTDLSHQRLINILADKHDEYVNGDPVLPLEEKSAQLAEAMVCRMAFAVRDVNVPSIRTPLNNMLTRLDAYVTGDPNLSPADAAAFHLNIAIVRRTVLESR